MFCFPPLPRSGRTPYMPVFFFFKKISQRNKRVKERRGGLGLLPTPGFSGSENMLVYVIMQ